MSDFPPPGGVPGPPSARTVVLDALRSAPAPATAADLAAECSVPLSSVRFHLNALLLTGTVRRTTDPANGRGRPRVRYSAVRSAPLPAIASGYRLLAEILAESLAGGADDRPASGPGAGQAGGPGAAAQARQAGRRWGQRMAAAADHDGPGSTGPDMTGPGDTGPGDTGPGDTGPGDTGPGDTGPGDTGQDDDGRGDPAAIAAGAAALFTAMGFDAGLEPSLRPAGIRLRLRQCPFAGMARERPEVVCAAHLGVLRGYLDGRGGTDLGATLEPWNTPTTCLAGIAFPAA